MLVRHQNEQVLGFHSRPPCIAADFFDGLEAAIVVTLPEQAEVRYRQIFTMVIAAGYGEAAPIGCVR
jgi:hypothetical protein